MRLTLIVTAVAVWEAGAAPTTAPAGASSPSGVPTHTPTSPPTAPTAAPSFTSLEVFSSGCSGRQQVVLNYVDEWSMLRSNPHNLTYSPDETCEWVVHGPPGSDVILSFATFATECAFDVIFVYDGDGPDAPLLLAGSGSTRPATLIAFSGTMRVMFYSDLNYVLGGFIANASASPDCGADGNCSGNGGCTTGRCACDAGWNGPYCALEKCPSGCNVGTGQGSCFNNSHCVCATGFAGSDCSTALRANMWEQLRRDESHGIGAHARSGHTATVIGDDIVVYGGIALSGNAPPATLGRLHLTDLAWYAEDPVAATMAPRYWHTAAHDVAANRLLIFGGYTGYLAPTSLASYRYNRTNELWAIDSTALGAAVAAATSLQNASGTTPPAVAEHTATVIGSTMVVLGGVTDTGFLLGVWELTLSGALTWSHHTPSGQSLLVAGHTAVYHSASGRILVFGGYSPGRSGLATRSRSLYSYDPVRREWRLLLPSGLDLVPSLAQHTATMVGDSMIVFGGNLHTNTIQTCYSPQTLVYKVSCNQWSHLAEPASFGGIAALGRLGHAAVLNGTSVVIYGGFSGSLRSDVIRLNIDVATLCNASEISPALACAREAQCAVCAGRTNCSSCVSNNACAWSTGGFACQLAVLVGTNDTTGPQSSTDSCGTASGFGSMQWHPARRYAAGQPPASSSTLTALAVSRGYQTNMFELVRGIVSAPSGSFVVTLRTASLASLSINGAVALTVTNSTNSAVLGTFEQPTNVTLVLQVTTIGGDHSTSVTWTSVPVSATFNDTAFTRQSALPWGQLTCLEYSDCAGCALDDRCSWNLSHEAVSGSGPGACVPTPLSSGDDVVLASIPEACVSCGDFVDCQSCVNTSPLQCEWTAEFSPIGSFACRARTEGVTGALRVASECPTACSARSTCGDCLAPVAPQAEVCAWCPATLTCFDFGTYDDEQIFGQCPAWFIETCPLCSDLATCSSCLARQGCGWCGDSSSGTCLSGNATSFTLTNGTSFPSSAPCHAQTGNITSLSAWDFEQCPSDYVYCATNVSASVLQCGGNATCVNSTVGHSCICDAGYAATNASVLPSAQNPCIPECPAGCVNAACPSPGVCSCNLGWTGPNCDIDCGCNQHGLCRPNATFGSGDCTLCDTTTTGPNCSQCAVGYYGSALNGGTCSPCNCSGHGNFSQGICDSMTGECFCTDYTAGENCELCLPGFVRDGDHCFVGCQFEVAQPHEDRASVRHRLTQRSAGIWTRPMLNSDVTTSCQWFIDSGVPNSTVTLAFDELNTECFYDYIHVFDSSDPTPASMLAVYSGVDAPGPIQSTTGTMVVQFRTDQNYVVPGRRALKAVYTVTPCPGSNQTHNCSGHGTCVSGTCACETGFFGRGCESQNCTLDCSLPSAGCVNVNHGFCVCNASRSDVHCASSVVSDHWYPMNVPLLPGSVEGLVGHSTVYSALRDTAWTFGGFNVRSYSAAVVRLDFSSGSTTIFPGSTTGWPAGRYMHSAVLTTIASAETMIIFGGSDSETSYLNDLWYADMSGSDPIWTNMTSVMGGERPPGMMGQTATLVGSAMFVFGGLTRHYGLHAAMYRYDLTTTTWTRIVASGAPPDGLYGHSSALVNGQIVIFGGVRNMPVHGQYVETIKSSYISSFNPATNVFTPMLPLANCSDDRSDCMARRFHTATLVDNRYLIVFGGCPFYHGFGNDYFSGMNLSCFSNDLHVLDLSCGTQLGWITADDFGVSSNAPMVRSGHTAVYRPSAHELVVLGGFNGVALNDVTKYTVPTQFCSRHETEDLCLVDPSNCTWNSTSEFCTFTSSVAPNLIRRNSSATCLTERAACNAFVEDDAMWWSALFPGSVNPAQCDACNRDPFCTGCVSRPPPRRSNIRCVNPNATTCAPNGTLLPNPETLGSMCSSPCAAFRGSCAECTEVGGPLGCVYNNSNLGTCFSASANSGTSILCTQEPSCADRVGRVNCTSRGGGCHWCESTEMCHDGFGVYTEYAFGQCFEYSGDVNQYSCETETSCATCVSTSRCGWCDNGNGTGVCMSGSPSGPGNGTCTGTAPTNPNPNATHTWNWWLCPNDISAQTNPCITANGTNVCGPNSTCTTLTATAVFSDSYRCSCGQGYSLATNGSTCVPSCGTESCVHGVCSAPGVCTCDIGWHGAKCDHDCLCNDHSTCSLGPGQCDECLDGTTGVFCRDCRSGFYGNGTRGAEPYAGTCARCIEACNGRSSTCKSSPADPGPVCIGCDGNAHGDFCHQCDAGYFIDPAIQQAAFAYNSSNGGLPWSRQEQQVNTSVLHAVERYLLANLSVEMRCTLCQCNGHSAMCDPVTGENCQCQNFTRTDTLSTRSPDQCYQAVLDHGACYDTQCAACLNDIQLDGQLWKLQPPGDGPVNGTLCYINIDEMQMSKGKLGNLTVLPFALHKRFINVDMRVYVRASNPSALAVYVLQRDLAAYTGGELNLESASPLASVSPLSGRTTSVRINSETDAFKGSIYIYVVLEALPSASGRRRRASTYPESDYEIFFSQAQITNLHLFIFFTSFFCCFYLVVFALGVMFAMKAAHSDRLMEEQEAVEMANLSSRPSATVRLLTPSIALNPLQAQAAVKLQASGTLTTMPVSWQPHKSDHAAVAAFVLEFPGTSEHRSFSLGVGLVSGEHNERPCCTQDEQLDDIPEATPHPQSPQSPSADMPFIREARL